MADTPGNDRSSNRTEFLRLRAQFVKGLVKLAGAEPVPGGLAAITLAELVQLANVEPGRAKEILEAAQGSTNEERRKSLKEALEVLNNAFDTLQKSTSIDPNVQSMKEKGPAAEAVVRKLLSEFSAATADQHKTIPEAERKQVVDFVNEVCTVPKIFVAVHGIGDQFQNETVQLVAQRVCDFVGQPAALPLGRFHGPGVTVTGAFLPDPDRDPPVDCGFAEVYWAGVPRIPVQDAHILEDPKKWVRALVERLRLKAPNHAVAGQRARCAKAKCEDERLESLLEELIQGIVVADRLVFLADKAGLFKFDLKKLLNDYLNDVQVVTEFEDYRRDLLKIFDDVFTKIHKYFPQSEIYIVAHSEGTVVSFMGLLSGLSRGAEWVGMVRGFMTIGSPLNKHVRFWPELFTQFKAPTPTEQTVAIRWKNYYDFGDPIGYDLKPTREWMAEPDKAKKDNPWTPFFAFKNPRDANEKAANSGDDIGFTRYHFPGEAHNDYWTDNDVFGHFIQEVVNKEADGKSSQDALPPEPPGMKFGVPGTKGTAFLTSYCLPYALAALLLLLATYLLYKPVRGCLDPISARFETPPQVLGNVTGLAGVIAAMSLLARIPRLSRGRGWGFLAVGLAVFFSCGYLLVSTPNAVSIESFLDRTGGTCCLSQSSSTTPINKFINNYNILLIGVLIAIGILGKFIVGLRPVLWTLLPLVVCVLVLRLGVEALSATAWHGPFRWYGLVLRWHALGLLSVVWVVGLSAACVSRHYPRFGTKPLVHTGGLLILLIVMTQFVTPPDPQPQPPEARVKTARAVEKAVQEALTKLDEQHRDPQMVADAAHMQIVAEAAPVRGPIWPVIVAGAAFLYVWWLAIITFDLTFVWHLYVRWSGAQEYVDERMGKKTA